MFFVICQGYAQTSTPLQGSREYLAPGAWVTESYLPLLKDKKVGLVVNHTSTILNVHLADSLIHRGVDVVTLFAPEHGIRGLADAGELINNDIDSITGAKIVSLYGDHKKPTASDLEGIDILMFDIQDVGVRFYTYISTLHYVMEACAENGIPLIVLDRPNPNGHYVDGPVLDTLHYRSFVGMHPIPVVYGMTIGELAKMINGEGWISKKCKLLVIPCLNYDHTMTFPLPVKPSPNLPDQRSILLYPGICFFEGTSLSLGRGTRKPFQYVGHPDYPDHTFSFKPTSMPGAKYPPLKDTLCYGEDLSRMNIDSFIQTRSLNLSVLLHFYNSMDKKTFFKAAWFDKLAGNSTFRESIQAGKTEAEIRMSWLDDIYRFKQRRKLYLLYQDF